jgi:hypothetical protein
VTACGPEPGVAPVIGDKRIEAGIDPGAGPVVRTESDDEAEEATPEAIFAEGGFEPSPKKFRPPLFFGFSVTSGLLVIVIGLTLLYIRLVFQFTGVAACTNPYCHFSVAVGSALVGASYGWWIVLALGGALIGYGLWDAWKER